MSLLSYKKAILTDIKPNSPVIFANPDYNYVYSSPLICIQNGRIIKVLPPENTVTAKENPSHNDNSSVIARRNHQDSNAMIPNDNLAEAISQKPEIASGGDNGMLQDLTPKNPLAMTIMIAIISPPYKGGFGGIKTFET
jgi:hypothetical protein